MGIEYVKYGPVNLRDPDIDHLAIFQTNVNASINHLRIDKRAVDIRVVTSAHPFVNNELERVLYLAQIEYNLPPNS